MPFYHIAMRERRGPGLCLILAGIHLPSQSEFFVPLLEPRPAALHGAKPFVVITRQGPFGLHRAMEPMTLGLQQGGIHHRPRGLEAVERFKQLVRGISFRLELRTQCRSVRGMPPIVCHDPLHNRHGDVRKESD